MNRGDIFYDMSLTALGEDHLEGTRRFCGRWAFASVTSLAIVGLHFACTASGPYRRTYSFLEMKEWRWSWGTFTCFEMVEDVGGGG